MRCYPPRGPRKGLGARIDDASGFLRAADDVVEDVRQGLVSKEKADITPGFGTYHPQDVKQLTDLTDPTPIDMPRPDTPGAISARDLGYSDAEVEASIRLGVPLRKVRSMRWR
jgi:hypothetical protein